MSLSHRSSHNFHETSSPQFDDANISANIGDTTTLGKENPFPRLYNETAQRCKYQCTPTKEASSIIDSLLKKVNVEQQFSNITKGSIEFHVSSEKSRLVPNHAIQQTESITDKDLSLGSDHNCDKISKRHERAKQKQVPHFGLTSAGCTYSGKSCRSSGLMGAQHGSEVDRKIMLNSNICESSSLCRVKNHFRKFSGLECKIVQTMSNIACQDSKYDSVVWHHGVDTAGEQNCGLNLADTIVDALDELKSADTTVDALDELKSADTTVDELDELKSADTTVDALDESKSADTTVDTLDESKYTDTTVDALDESKFADTTVDTLDESKSADTTVDTLDESKSADTTVDALDESKSADTTVDTLDESKSADTTVDALDESKSADTTVDALNESKFSSKSASTRSRRQRQIEIEQVHQVYTQIAPHCDNVRQKAWPRVKRFLKELQPGSMVVDVGCGNGRYLNINSSIFKTGCDLCPPFLEQARVQGHEVMIADNIALPYRDATFDAVISIGVVHHFASLKRRIRAISELSRVLCSGGKLMVYVWAFEQIHRKFGSQDVLIPWVKPEVKDHSRRNTISCLPESDNLSIDSDPMGNSATSISKRCQCNEYFNVSGTVVPRERSKSLNEDKSAIREFRDRWVESPKFGVFDRRDYIRRELEITAEGGMEQENADFNGVSDREGQGQNINNSGKEDLKDRSKWPGNLVSECRKAGKYFRGMSSRSDNQNNTEVGLVENAVNAFSYLQQLQGNERSHDKTSARMAKDFQIETPKRSLTNKYPNAVLGSVVKAVRENNQNYGGAAQNAFTTTKIGEEIPSMNPDPSVNIKINSCLGKYKENISASAAITTCHNKPCRLVHTTLNTKESCNPVTYTTDFRTDNFTCNTINVAHIHHSSVTVASACHQLSTSVSARSSSRTSQESSTVNKMCNSQCLDYLHGCIGPANLQPLSSMSMTLSNPKDLKIRELSSATHSDKTVTNIELNNQSDINPIRLKDTSRKSLKHNSNLEDVKKLNRNSLQPSSSGSTSHDDTDQLQGHHHEESENFLNNKIGHLPAEKWNHLSSRSNTSTEVNYPSSEWGDSTDCFDSDTIFSLAQDSSQRLHNIHCQRNKTNPGTRAAVQENDNVSLGESAQRLAQIPVNAGLTSEDITKHHFRQTPEMESSQSKDDADVIIKDDVPFRANFKTFFHKLRDYFHLRSKNESTSFSCFHSGKSLTNHFISEMDSNETPESNFSTHSSCYPGIFSVSQNREASEKVPGLDNCDDTNCLEYDARTNINNTQTPSLGHVLENERTDVTMKPLRIDIFDCKHKPRQHDFVDDVSEKADGTNIATPGHSPTDHYMFHVENLSLSVVKKESIFHSIVKKWSGLFNKDEMSAQTQSCVPVASSSLSSSEGNEETLGISLVGDDSENISDKKTSKNRGIIRRPTSLDFSKKRTRRKGRRPVPRTDTNVTENKTEYKLQNINKIIPNKKLLTLSDAMTLLGDGATEESVSRRLDDSAKTVFLQMKRMNFAIRKFPMSSLDSDSNDETCRDIPEISTASDTPYARAAQTKHTSLKMRRDKLIFSSRHRLSDSFGSQDNAAKRRRRNVDRQKELTEADSTSKVNLLQQRQYLSEDLKNFLDIFEIRRIGHDSHLLYSQSMDTKPELFVPLHRTSETENVNGSMHKVTYRSATLAGPSKISTFCEQKEPLVENIDDSANRFGINKEIASGKSLDENDARASDELIKYDIDNVHTSGIKRLNGSYKLCDYGKSITEGAATESTVKPYTIQSRCEEKCYSGNRNIAPSSKANSQLASYSHRRHAFRCDSSNENVDSFTITSSSQSKSPGSNSNSSLSRYYHVFKKEELDQLVTHHVPSLRIVETFYDHANWCIIAEKI